MLNPWCTGPIRGVWGPLLLGADPPVWGALGPWPRPLRGCAPPLVCSAVPTRGLSGPILYALVHFAMTSLAHCIATNSIATVGRHTARLHKYRRDSPQQTIVKMSSQNRKSRENENGYFPPKMFISCVAVISHSSGRVASQSVLMFWGMCTWEKHVQDARYGVSMCSMCGTFSVWFVSVVCGTHWESSRSYHLHSGHPNSCLAPVTPLSQQCWAACTACSLVPGRGFLNQWEGISSQSSPARHGSGKAPRGQGTPGVK